MGKKITRGNYEAFMIDHLDGTLSIEREAELLLFLEAHIDLKAELEGLDEMVLEQDLPVFEFRDGLKKSILDSGKVNTDNFEEFCVAFYEGDLMDVEQEHLHNFVHDHPSLSNDFQLFGKLKLSGENYIQFPYKTNLQQFASATSETISESNYIDFLIAQNEGDLPNQRALELSQFLGANPQYKNDAQQISSLKLKADSSIIFENKSMLKRRAVMIPIANKWMNVAAASVAIFVVFYSLIPRHDFNEQGNAIVNPSKIIENHSIVDLTPNNSKGMNTVEDDFDNSEIVEVKQSQKTSTISNTTNHRQVKESRSFVKLASVSPISCKGLKVDVSLKVDQPQYPVDVLAQADVNAEEMSDEKSITLNGYAGKAATRVGKLLGKTDRLKKDRIKGQLRNIADLAVTGFNKMTEADLELPSRAEPNTDEVEK